MPIKGDSKYQVGNKFESKYGSVIIIDYVDPKKLLVRFENSGYEYWTSSTRITSNELRDPLQFKIFGVGINDLDYEVQGKDENNQRKICPFYRVWINMLGRCYSNKWSLYEGCYVVDEWLYASTFKKWMIDQNWQGNQLDKDLLVMGNKEYGPNTCIFLSAEINVFIITSSKTRTGLPQGVRKHRNSFTVSIGIDGKNTYLGSYKTVEEAEKVFKEAKLAQAKVLAARQNCPIITNALIKRYS